MNNRKIYLFLDDERDPRTHFSDGDYFRELDWKIAKSYDEAVKVVEEFGFPTIAHLDHDIGPGKTGEDFLKWLIGYGEDHRCIPNDFQVFVHSANYDGARNMRAYYRSYLKSKTL
jgi:hypothetical protein